MPYRMQTLYRDSKRICRAAGIGYNWLLFIFDYQMAKWEVYMFRFIPTMLARLFNVAV